MKSRSGRPALWGYKMRSVGAVRPAAAAARARAFSLLDVMVTISVIAVLIAILMPALGSVRETTHRVVCSSNVRQIGLGIAMYTEANQDLLPPSGFALRPQETIWLRRGPETDGGWDGLGNLYADDYLPAPQIFYCPSHSGSHPFLEYADEWGSDWGRIAGNYQYRGKGPGDHRHLQSIVPQSAALVTDGLRTQSDFNHRVGANVLRADLSVFFFWDPEGELFNSLPSVEGEVQAGPIAKAWEHIDAGGGL